MSHPELHLWVVFCVEQQDQRQFGVSSPYHEDTSLLRSLNQSRDVSNRTETATPKAGDSRNGQPLLKL